MNPCERLNPTAHGALLRNYLQEGPSKGVTPELLQRVLAALKKLCEGQGVGSPMGSRVERPSEQTVHEQEAGPDLSLIPLNQLEGAARVIIREALDPEGLSIPERELRKWIVALGRLYELKR